MKHLKKEFKKAVAKMIIQSDVVETLKKEIYTYYNYLLYERYKGTKISVGDLQYEFNGAHTTLHEDFDSCGWGIIDNPEVVLTISFVLTNLGEDDKDKVEEINREYRETSYMGPYYNKKNSDIFVLYMYCLTFKTIDDVIDGDIKLEFTPQYRKN